MTLPADARRDSPAAGDDPTLLPGVLFVVGCTGDTVRYRCYHQQEQLARYGVRATNRFWTDPHLFGDLLDHDVIILHRVMFRDFIPDLLGLLHELGKVAVFDTDDLIFDPTMARYDSSLATMSADQANRYRQSIRLHGRTLDYCDYALTTTQFLAEQLTRRGKRAFVNRNSLNDVLLQISENAYRQRSSHGEAVVVGYFSGSPSHERDFAVAAPALLKLMERYPQTRLHILGFLALDSAFARFGDRVQHTPRMPWQKLPHAIAQVDINIAPLELDNPFCQSKSELKYFEAGAVGVPTVASPTDAFQFAITHGENGLLADTSEAWFENLERLVADPAYRRALGEAARQDVRTRYTSAARGKTLVAILNRIWADWRARPTSRPAAQPARRTIARIVNYFDNLKLTDDVARHEEIIAQLAAEIHRRQRHPWRWFWAWLRQAVKRTLRQSYTHEFFSQGYVLAPPLSGRKRLGGRFTATRPNLYRLDIPLATYHRVNTADVILHLQDPAQPGKDLATVRVPAAQLGDNQPYRFTFEPIPDSRGREFSFYLESPAAFAGNAVSPWMVHGLPQVAFAPYYRSGETLP